MRFQEKKLHTLEGAPGWGLKTREESWSRLLIWSLLFDVIDPLLELSLKLTDVALSTSKDSFLIGTVLADLAASFWEVVGKVWAFLENCVAAACAPAIAALRLEDLSTSDVLDWCAFADIDPGFKENGSCKFGSGNLTGRGTSTGVRPLIAASFIWEM